MEKIVLISCSSKKKNEPAPAYKLYDSTLFNKSLKYANSLDPDKIFILSAKYHLLEIEEIIKPYDVTLNNMGIAARKEWADKVVNQLKDKTDLDNDLFVILAGKKYREHILSYLEKFDIPMKGLGIGQQLQYLTNKVE